MPDWILMPPPRPSYPPQEVNSRKSTQILRKNRFFLSREKVLTAEQKAKLAASVDLLLIEVAASPVKLTPAQIVSVQQAVGSSGPAELFEKIDKAVEGVLTPEQTIEMKKNKAMKALKKRYETAYLKAGQIEIVRAACGELAKDSKLDAKAVADKLVEKLATMLAPEEMKSLEQPTKLTGPL